MTTHTHRNVTPCTQRAVDLLNRQAKKLVRAGETPAQALLLTADAAALSLRRISDDGTLRLYQFADGTLVNLWLCGPEATKIREGGAGFDLQIEHWEYAEVPND